MKVRKIIFSVSITVVIFLCFYLFVDFEPFFKALKNVKIGLLGAVLVVQFLTYISRAIRFELILEIRAIKKLFSISSIHFFLNKVLPARTGEISLPILFNKYLDVQYKKGIGALIFFRILDLFSVVILFSLSLFFVKSSYLNSHLMFIIALLIIIGIVFFWIKLKLLTTLLLRLIQKIKTSKYEKYKLKIEKFVYQVHKYKESHGLSFIIKINLITLLTWLLTYVSFYFIIKAFSFHYSFIEVIFATTLVNFSMMIPIGAIGNFGIFEAGWAAGFFLIGMTLDMSISVGLFANVFTLIVNGLFALIGSQFLTYYKRSKTTNETS